MGNLYPLGKISRYPTVDALHRMSKRRFRDLSQLVRGIQAQPVDRRGRDAPRPQAPRKA